MRLRSLNCGRVRGREVEIFDLHSHVRDMEDEFLYGSTLAPPLLNAALQTSDCASEEETKSEFDPMDHLHGFEPLSDGYATNSDFDPAVLFGSHQKEAPVFLGDGYGYRTRSEYAQRGPGLSYSELFGKKPFTLDNEYVAKLLEDVAVFYQMMVKATDPQGYYLAVVSFLKMQCGDAPLFTLKRAAQVMDYFTGLFSTQIQSAEDIFGAIRSKLNFYDEIKNSLIYKKLYKVVMYLLSFSVFEKVGVTFTTLQFTTLQEEAIRKKHHMGVDFVHTCIDTVVFLCERGCQYLKTGEISTIFHSSNTYSDWLLRARELQRQSHFLSNPRPHGFTRFSFIADLKTAIVEGDAIYRYGAGRDALATKGVSETLNALKMIESIVLTRRDALKSRRAPFSLCLTGGSSVAKSLLTKVLINHYGKLFNLPEGDEYTYVRNAIEKHWTNFNSTQWAIILDDVAFMNPSFAAQGDPSMLEMLQVINDVGFTPIQADLADKGRTPLLARCVIATTNTVHLNADQYFACPLAIRRRLPFVVEVIPKPEYTKDNCMMDGAAVPELEDGSYPDQWILKVKRVIPNPLNKPGGKQHAALETLQTYDNIYDFLDWYSQAAHEYECLADKVARCDDVMRSIVLCPSCKRPTKHCKCEGSELSSNSGSSMDSCYGSRIESSDVYEDMSLALVVQEERLDDMLDTTWVQECKRLYAARNTPIFEEVKPSRMEFFTVAVLRMVIWIYYNFFWFQMLMDYSCGTTWIYRYVFKYRTNIHLWRYFYKQIGNKVNRRIGTPKILAQIVVGCAAAAATYKVGKFAYQHLFPQEKVQGAEFSRGAAPVSKAEERNNVWFKDDYQCTTFDVSPVTTSSKQFEFSQILARLERNTVSAVATRSKLGVVELRRPSKLVCIGGHIYMTNNHCLPDDGDFELEMVVDVQKEGINQNMTILVTSDEVQRFPACDLAFIRIRNYPARKNIISLFCKESLRGVHKGTYIMREPSGGIELRPVDNISLVLKQSVPDLETNLDLWRGIAASDTANGDCGSLLVSNTGFGPIILGIHVLGADGKKVWSTRVTAEFLTGVVSLFEGIIIQSGEPRLSAPSVQRDLSVLDKKSSIRYFPAGTARVYGSFTGFRGKNKSRVAKSLLAPSLLKRGYAIKYGPPVMNSWVPWNRALTDMTRPVTHLRTDILTACVGSFLRDIYRGLSPEQLSTLMVYDDFTAVNGAAGVSYVDKINRNTSAGNPWKKSKKFFMEPLPPTESAPDPVAFNKEIMDRVQDCIETYESGERYMAVFCGHLKDEAVSAAKMTSGATRVFTGGCLEYTIVVRKYLLSVIKLIQDNRFVFESGPGTIAQSLEWQEIRNYLVRFGDQRIIAGDYGKFDKRMPPAVILAAYDIIFDLCKTAGYSDAELCVIAGIAEDTAFPLVDFNGDLVEFFGSNPSGHPLTVIVNGLANSLYMRYCFAVLSPKKNADDFKNHVALMTYGDDNAMGVSAKAPWFNHTAIQKVLADVDIVYTMADKAAKSVPYIHIDETSFLKRTWRRDADIGAFVCPLEHDSIEKMLMVTVASKTIPPEAQAIQVIATAIREYFWYGKHVFETRSQLLKEVVVESGLSNYVEESTFPDWEELREAFWANSQHVKGV